MITNNYQQSKKKYLLLPNFRNKKYFQKIENMLIL